MFFRLQTVALSHLQRIAGALNRSKFVKSDYNRNLYESMALAQAKDTPALASLIDVNIDTLKEEVRENCKKVLDNL